MGKLLWLASYPKSGNTWLRTFLHNLLRNPEAGYDINRITEFTLAEADTLWYRRHLPKPGSTYTFEDVIATRPNAHLDMTRAFPDTVFVKTHNAMVADGGQPILTLALTAGAIYVVRNPLDVAISYSHHLGRSIDATIDFMNAPGARTPNTDKNVYQILGSWSENVQSWTAAASPGLLVLRYEDMLDKAEATFGSVARFLGLAPPPARLKKAIRGASFATLRAQEERQGFKERSPSAERFFRAGRAGQWRTELNADQIRRLVEAHRVQMARFGYLPEGY
jgi:sulfotransferase family protein